MIPDICHFVFGLEEQTTNFKFCYYLSILSAKIVNRPSKIMFHYHFEPKGQWWEKTKRIKGLELRRVHVPTSIGVKTISRVAHKADVVRMNVLYQHGGVYHDIDTICVRPWGGLLDNQVVLGLESNVGGVPNGICNAIMMTVPQSRFLAEWMLRYPIEYRSDGWREASVILPLTIAKSHPEWLRLMPPSTFFVPGWHEYKTIFTGENDIPADLVTLHLWESYSSQFIDAVDGWKWAKDNAHTLYAKIMQSIMKQLKGTEKELHYDVDGENSGGSICSQT